MPFDPAFAEGSTAGRESFPNLKYSREKRWRNVSVMDEVERLQTVSWISGLADWSVAFDFTFGTGVWQGRRHGRRRDLRDGLLVVRKYKRGFDCDDALDLFRKFMGRVSPDTSWFAAIEPNRHVLLNPGFHGHAMLASSDELFRKSLHDQWERENGWSKCNLIRTRAGRENYCTKHLVGRGLIFGYEIKTGELLSPGVRGAL